MLPVNLLLLEENRRQIMRNLNEERILMRNNRNPFEMDDMLFKHLFRINKDIAHHILNMIIPFMNNNIRRNALEPHHKLFTALIFYASGNYQRFIGQSYSSNLSQQSVSNCVQEITNIIYERVRQEYITFPTTDQEVLHIKQKFHRLYGFPGVIGAIDCTHIKILAPRNEEHNYLNRKGYHSKNVQIVCNYQYTSVYL